MSKEQLQEELEAVLRREHEPTFERMRKRQAELDALSDDEWWTQQIEASESRNHRFATVLESMKAEMIQHRFDHCEFLNADGLERIVRKRADELMPALLAVRKELGEDGPLTEDQYRMASMRNSQETIASMLEKLKQGAGRQTDPRRREIVAQFAANVEADLVDMKVMRDPTTVTEEHLQEVTTRILARKRIVIVGCVEE